jgi:Amt family ammonium transporter
MIGIILLGIFGSVTINAAGSNGLLHGGSGFFGVQLLGVLISSVYAFVFTYGMLWLINKVTPVRLTLEEETTGLDTVLHGEEAYTN